MGKDFPGAGEVHRSEDHTLARVVNLDRHVNPNQTQVEYPVLAVVLKILVYRDK